MVSLFFLLVFFFGIDQVISATPIIGILGKPVEDCVINIQDQSIVPEYVLFCIQSYYVKWIESAGGQVVPIRIDEDPKYLEEMYMGLNGVLFTGGEYDIQVDSAYRRVAKFFYDRSIADKDDYFPIWGTCMGFQLLHILTANDSDVLSHGFHSEDIPLDLDFTDLAKSSRLFGWLPEEIYTIFTVENVTMNFHHDGILPTTYQKYPSLAEFYNILSTNYDRDNREFVSTIEAKDHPIYATQWHPERPQFEFDYHIPHSTDSILAMQYMASFFISETRKNTHQIDLKTLQKRLIYNYCPQNLEYGDQMYLF